MEIVDYIFSKLGTLLFMAVLSVEVYYYFVHPMRVESKKHRKEENEEDD